MRQSETGIALATRAPNRNAVVANKRPNGTIIEEAALDQTSSRSEPASPPASVIAVRRTIWARGGDFRPLT